MATFKPFLLLFLWISVPAAQLSGNYPPCAVSCIFTDTYGGCSNLDIVCFCSSLPYLQSLALCAKNTCSPQDYQNSTTQLIDTCASAGVTITLSAITASSTSTSPSTSTRGTFSTISTITSDEKFNTTTSTLASTSNSSAQQITTSNPTAIATFTSGTLLTGTCITPQFTSASTDGIVTEYPQLGCANDNLGCCPLNFTSLTSCPADYTTTSQACCPSGWSIFSTSLGGAIPCYSSLLIRASSPTAPLTSGNAPTASTSIVIIVDRVFTYKFTLQPSQPSGLGEAAKVGIGIGVSVGVVLAALLCLGFFLLRRKRHARRILSSEQLPATLVYIPSKPELEGIGVHELAVLPGPGPRAELDETVREMGA